MAGADGLIGAFANETASGVWFTRERTPSGVQGLVGEDASSVANRRPLGLRANSPYFTTLGSVASYAPERPNKKTTVNCKKTLCKKYFIIPIDRVEKSVFLQPHYYY
ncbi:MAG: hypothetical protein K5882_07570 [Bacteroidales bacterium]|nr:hypothetical protein [Bacteroidales bacterium]